jgi:hypothetical protein
MKNIAIHAIRNPYAVQIFDKYYAYLQSLDVEKFQAGITIRQVNDPKEFTSNDIKVRIDYMPRNDIDFTAYDFVFFCNGSEPIHVATKTLVNGLQQPNAYLMCNSYVGADHQLKNKIVYFSDNVDNCRIYWARSFYPGYYQNIVNSRATARTKDFFFINGQNRSWRQYIVNLLQDHKVNVDVKSVLSKVGYVAETNDAHWESPEDQQFREWVNEYYKDVIQRNGEYNYYENSVHVGPDNKFGVIPPGYFILPEYYEYRCVIFPETNWQNNEMAITEKILKCCWSGSIPWPIGGSKMNQLYNEFGIMTAWNLLPEELQAYDDNIDHKQRHKQTVLAIKWLGEHADLMLGEQAQQIIEHNHRIFTQDTVDYSTMQQLDSILKQ